MRRRSKAGLLVLVAAVACGRAPEAASPVVPASTGVPGEVPSGPTVEPERPSADEGSGPEGGPAESGVRVPAFTLEARLAHASHPLPEGAPTVVVHAPDGLRVDRPLQLVVFLHGWSGCARVLALPGPVGCLPGGPPEPGWALVDRHDEAGTASLLLVPQLAFLRREGRPGRLAERGFFRSLLEELLGETLASHLGGPRSLEAVESVTLVAHSAGFEPAMAILRRGGLDDLVRNVVLMDALYAGPAVFAEWAAGGQGGSRRLVSLYTGRGRTWTGSATMAGHARQLLGPEQVAVDPPGPLGAAIRSHRVVVARSPHPHRDVPARHLAEVLPALGLRPR